MIYGEEKSLIRNIEPTQITILAVAFSPWKEQITGSTEKLKFFGVTAITVLQP